MKVDGKTELIGLLGWPVSHTKSPILHNAVSEATGRNLVYLPLAVHPDAVGDAIRGLPALGFVGVNATVPHKQAIMPFLDEIDPAAQAIGAVNTIFFTERDDESYPPKSTGYNTDWIGLREDLLGQGVRFDGRDCLVLGAGGSARAVVYMLLAAQARVYLLARRPEQAESVAADMLAYFPDAQMTTHGMTDLEMIVGQVERPLILNTTPLGMTPHIDRSVWPDDLPFPTESFVYDLVYTPATTKLMRQAAESGCGSSNGLGMLLGQAAEAYRIWTGHMPDLEIMRRAL